MVIVKLQCDNKRGDVEHHGEAPDEGGDAAENEDESSKAAATHLSSKIFQPRFGQRVIFTFPSFTFDSSTIYLSTFHCCFRST